MNHGVRHRLANNNAHQLLQTFKGKRLEKAIKHNLEYYKQLKDTLEAHKTKHANTLLRNRMLEQQKKMNHTLEYDRLRGLVENTLTHDHSRRVLKDRMKKLEALGIGGLTFS